MNGEPQGTYFSFDSLELLLHVLTPRRWHIIRSMTGAGPLSVQALAERSGIDAASVQHDVHVLLDTGVLDSNADGTLEFPYDAVHFDFMVTAA
ncbi:HVO_A0114 family putative DNA-binding protein [Paraburkholderia nodosa]